MPKWTKDNQSEVKEFIKSKLGSDVEIGPVAVMHKNRLIQVAGSDQPVNEAVAFNVAASMPIWPEGSPSAPSKPTASAPP